MTTATQIKPQKLFIDGKWLEPSSGKYFQDINPATEDSITEIAEANEKDVELVVHLGHFDKPVSVALSECVKQSAEHDLENLTTSSAS